MIHDPSNMKPEHETQKRLDRIEAAIAHLEHQFDALNAVVVSQENRLGRLEKQVALLTRVLEQEELERIQAQNPKPPHHSI
jgi:uncharacterized coiled-coil protein SlyX